MPASAAYHTRPMPDAPDDPVDATLLAARAAAVVRRYSLQQLPRVREAGGLPGTEMAVEFRFGPAESGVAVDTHLEGTVVLTCQRCLQPVALPVTSDSLLAVLDTEAAADELPEDREPVVADATRLDLGFLAEEEVLLALPFVPMHDEACAPAAVEIDEAGDEALPEGERRHRPFENLRDLLNKH